MCNGTGVYVEKSDSTYVAYLGNFKRDFRHGSGLQKNADGSVAYGVWRWNSLKKNTERPATDEEIEKLEKEIIRLQRAVKVSQL